MLCMNCVKVLNRGRGRLIGCISQSHASALVTMDGTFTSSIPEAKMEADVPVPA